MNYGDLTWEEALKESKDIELNIYYEYYKNKDLLIEKMGGFDKLIAYLASLEYINYSDLSYEIYKDLKIYLNNNNYDENVYNILFEDSKPKQDVKVSKKVKNNLKK